MGGVVLEPRSLVIWDLYFRRIAAFTKRERWWWAVLVEEDNDWISGRISELVFYGSESEGAG